MNASIEIIFGQRLMTQLYTYLIFLRNAFFVFRESFLELAPDVHLDMDRFSRGLNGLFNQPLKLTNRELALS